MTAVAEAKVLNSYPGHARAGDGPWLGRLRAAAISWRTLGAEPTSCILGTGAVAAMEEELCRLLEVPMALALPSATMGLRVALQALGVASGDEVILAAYGWPAAAAAAVSLGATPIPVDVRLPTCTLDPEAAARAITPRTRAVVATHLFGLAMDLRELSALCHRSGIPLVEDAAQALGARIRGTPAGTVGSVGVFSFGPGKIVDAAGGGALVCREEEIYLAAVRASQHPARQLLAGIPEPDACNLQARIQPAAALVAWHGLHCLEDTLVRRRRILTRLTRDLQGRRGVALPHDLDAHAPAGVALPIAIDPEREGTLGEELGRLGVHLLPAPRNLLAQSGQSSPETPGAHQVRRTARLAQITSKLTGTEVSSHG